MEFEAYLASKRIDSARFSSAEPALWQAWKSEFELVHPNSFTLQKLNLINPIRRKYQLVVVESPKAPASQAAKPASPVLKTPPTADGNKPAPAPVGPRISRPGMPKPMVRPSSDANADQKSDDLQSSPKVEAKEVAPSLANVDAHSGNADTALVSLNAAAPLSSEAVADASTSASADGVGDVTAQSETHSELTPPGNETQQTSIASEPVTAKPDAEKSPSAVPPSSENPTPPAKPARPVMARPVIKPKPKPN